MSNQENICGVIVTFHPPESILAHLSALALQVGGVVVVDNGSSPASLVLLRASAQNLGFTLIENGANAGIAAALNTGVRWAKAQGFEAVALFDQDSAVTEGFMAAMLSTYQHHPLREWVAIVTPTQVERGTRRTRVQPAASDGSPLVTITSGSLMPLSIFDRCGWFQEELIIDCVDHEYCMRARGLGYTLAECRQAVLLVSVGSFATHRVFGLTLHARHYSARRRYYLTRNRLSMIHRFWKQQPAWCCRMLQDIVGDTIKVALVEEQRWSKMRYTGLGICDALRRRMGKVVEL